MAEVAGPRQAIMTLRRRTHIVIRGVVQGVGFRPFVYRLATALNLKGWVRNSTQGIFIDAEGDGTDIEEFLSRLPVERPPHSSIQSMESWHLDPCGYEKFEILPSEPDGKREALVLPDIATCPECIRDVFDPEDRRYRYPFTNCTHCGPRYSIIEAVPYDRQRTSMKEFSMCDECRAEYENPADRRFHAQPIACPACGPQLSLWNSVGETMASRYQALLNAVQLIRDGGILALKGLGGFQLVVRADSDDAVRDLRRKKHREEKPFAVMAPALQWARHECHVTTLEVRMLTAPESPIVLLERRRNTVSSLVAPDNPNLGVMLPYTPLHHLLMNECRIPVVATSGNISDEPLCIDEREALERLSGIADAYLVHERPIVRHVDDSVVRVMNDREIVLRRARGFAPLPITLPWDFPDAVAVGAHLKNTVAVSRGSNIFISQHIGDLETQQSIMAFQKTVADLGRLLNIEPTMVVSDLHPDYLSTAHASNSRLPMKRVQHHHAHVASCMADNHLSGNALGISWDGTGFGTDATIWGGEFLMVSGHAYERVATFHPFPLPGGEQAIRQPRRIALSLLEESVGLGHAGDLDVLKVFSPEEVRVLRQMMSSRINSPLTSSVGRLFDGVAALLGVLSEARYEGQAAMRLEYSIIPDEEIYPFEVERPGDLPAHVMWSPMIRAIVEDVRRGIAPGRIAARFHNTLVETIIHVARSVEERRVMLTGGCFQNKYLTERSISRLIAEGFVPYWHQRVPPNDGGISLGQLCVLAGVPSDRHVPTHSVEVAVESGVW